MNPKYVRHYFDAFPELSSEDLILRRITPDDAPTIREISFYDGVPAASEQEVLLILERIEQDYAQGDTVHWGICLQGVDEVVGTCGFYRGYPDNVGEIGYVLKEAYRGRGNMTKALRRVITFGLEEMALAGVVAYTDAANLASRGVLNRLGFREISSSQERLKFSLRLGCV